jgi:CubicO group peptidase (beta-lactamase class C family)
MEFVRRGRPAFPPGASNTGYVVLGAIVAEVSGRSYHDYVREHVFAPAGTRGADFYTSPRWHEDRRIAHPYHQLPSGERVDAIDDHGGFLGFGMWAQRRNGQWINGHDGGAPGVSCNLDGALTTSPGIVSRPWTVRRCRWWRPCRS